MSDATYRKQKKYNKEIKSAPNIAVITAV